MLTQTANPKSPQVAKFCRGISVERPPVLLRISPDDDSAPLDCFTNARRKVARSGGRIVLGWAIWEWPGLYIEAEHHAVYDPPQGRAWIDLTPPQVPQIVTRLFLPDSTAAYDFENEGVRRDNHRQALTKDPLVQRFFESARRHSEIMNSIPGVGEVQVTPAIARQLQSVQHENAQITMALAMKYTPRNARCFCGSGEKFKRCHGSRRA
ncbi:MULTISPECIES: SEC-C domain-containing protein [unclassified Mesorhizobium]|uniref:SEC-C domain-containing protein n=1 Tax=unclassified Mesorhizobium TaxID=325217 RepID=UPI000FD46A90|nr:MULTISPECIES: SEC-C domain-containing protein [unclassified Mesorhizobium]RUV04201.1 hypothetical protein EOA79_15180 [Mesorhizobium sp. M1A.F.Ca.IN.020.03.2.1]RWG87095.1 MAG: hypothetical protein EOQ70_13660 [Mesorhizobium sp.]RWK18267.1 MAG: hypothetical protein EOR41_14075 [Mesorhizobium sp.]